MYAISLYDITNHALIIPHPRPSHCSFFTDGIIFHVICKLPSSKVADIENLKAKFTKHSPRFLVVHIAKFFNHVVNHGFPPSWSSNIIHPIHKYGDPLNQQLHNYYGFPYSCKTFCNSS